MAGKKLTEKQEKIFIFIKNCIKDSGFPPTVREIGDNFEITVKGAYDHIKAIEKKGFIKTEQNKSRAIVVLEDDVVEETTSLKIPLVGRIAAGSPILAEENIEDYLSFPQSMLPSGDHFALYVQGDSMIEGGIYDGDIAIIKQQNVANNGEIVAAMVDDEATLKKLKIKDNQVQLMPQNSAYKPIVSENVTILGKLSALFRQC